MNRLLLAGLLGVTGTAMVAVLVTARQPLQNDSPAADITMPERSAPPPALAGSAAAPPVPAGAERLEPIAYTLVTTWRATAGAERSTTQRITRARDRAHVVLDGGGQEWLFERNPVHPDRVSGYLIDHAAREIRVQHDSDLRNSLRIRGWADVLLMRFDPGAVARLRDTGERRQVEGVRFHRFVASEEPVAGVTEVWWSQELLLPLAWTTRESDTVTVKTRVEHLSRDVDRGLLADPSTRFPGYEWLDATDARDHRS